MMMMMMMMVMMTTRDDYDYDVYDNHIIIMWHTFINIDSLHLPQILSRT